MSPLFFITTNPSKFASYQLFFKNLDIQLQQVATELYEPQTLDPSLIIKAKLTQAKEKFPNQKIMVDDRSLFIPALNNFPGPFMKLALSSLGADGFLKLMADKADRRMIFTTAVGFYDGRHDHFFLSDENGVMSTEKRGTHLRGWSEVLYIYIHDHYPTKTLAEYSDEEWEQHHDRVNQTQDLQLKIMQVLTQDSTRKTS